MKSFSSVLLLLCASTALAGAGAGYPQDHIAEFVVEKLDVTSLPDALWPRREKRKKTFRDYGFVLSQSEEDEFRLEAPDGASRYSVKVLERRDSGIYACIAEQRSPDKEISFERVILLKHRNPSDLLRGRESFHEFKGCPEIGVEPSEFTYGG